MRKIVLGLGISLDGYIARPSGAVDFLFMPKDYSMAPFFATVDTATMGRKTYDAAAHMGGGSFGNSGMTSYVFSRSRPAGKRGGVIFRTNLPPISSASSANAPVRIFGSWAAARWPAIFLEETWWMSSISALFQFCSAKASRYSPVASRSAISR